MLGALILPGPIRADWRDEIGYAALQQRLGSALPTGRTIQIAQIEMPVDDSTGYLPDQRDAQLVGKIINGRSGAGGVSDHATIVGQYCMGLTSSIGPGIRLIDSYEANDWAGSGLLNVNTDQPPRIQPRAIENHSWIGTFGSRRMDTDALRRIDWVVRRDGVVVAAGVKNGAGTPLPHLMCSAYNVIAVGVSSGRSSYGPTDVDTGGRIKPDIVAPVTATSWATPVVASCASLLIEAIEDRGDLSHLPPAAARSARPLLVKALLMGGASKLPWSDWHRGFERPASDGSAPLDYRYGAGQVNIDHSYRILEAGRQSPEAGSLAATGWDCRRITPQSPRRYVVELAEPVERASILVTWHRSVTAVSRDPLELRASLANIDLKLYRLGPDGDDELVDLSCSRIDNVEHLYLRNGAKGRYAFEVTTDRAWDYAITWDFQPAACRMRPPGALAHAAPDASPSVDGSIRLAAGVADSRDGSPVPAPPAR